MKTSAKVLMVLGAVVIVAAGTGTGYLLTGKQSKIAGSAAVPEAIITDREVGIQDTSQFKDQAQGVLEKGGINGEGTHRLIREGGPSQTVYLVSSVVDLDQFTGKKVEVWGETFDAARAGWFMDVGLVKILD